MRSKGEVLTFLDDNDLFIASGCTWEHVTKALSHVANHAAVHVKVETLLRAGVVVRPVEWSAMDEDEDVFGGES